MENMILSNGVKIPAVGFGTYKILDNDAPDVIKMAIDVGYRHFDTSTYYANETGVGKGIKNSNINRKDLFVTTKVWEDDQGYDRTLKAFDLSLKKLNMDYVDLYLIHWPKENSKETWRAFERIYNEGRAKAIGLSNFTKNDVESILSVANIPPMVNQIEFNPYLIRKPLITYLKNKNIQVVAWSPLKRGALMGEECLIKMAEKYQKTIAQIILRWEIEMGIIPIPKSDKIHQMLENIAVFDFSLDKSDIDIITTLEKPITD